MPDCFCETENGLLLIANGIQRPLRWNGLTSQAQPMGLTPPATGLTMAGTGQGPIVGEYYAYVRFYDDEGNYSNLSPISVLAELSSFDGVVDNIRSLNFQYIDQQARAGASGSTLQSLANLIDHPIQVETEEAHGLTSGTFVTLDGIGGSTAANGTWEIIVDGERTFRLKGLKSVSTYTGGGTYTGGVETITYSSVPVPQEPRITGRQILRNTNGQTGTFYVDVDTTDLGSTTGFTSTRDDEELSAQEAVPLLDTDGSPLADRFTLPPNHKSVFASHLGRVFAGVEVVYSEGCVSVENGSATVTGVGTEWKQEMGGRLLYVVGARQTYQIDSVDEAAQTLTLVREYQETTSPYTRYGIRPAPAEARLVYYSEAGLPEAWPAVNALSVPADGDDITALVTNGSFIYVVCARHIYRFTFQEDPAIDGYVFLNVDGRGCLNNRTWCEVEGSLYMMDEQGMHVFDGSQEVQSVSAPIQDLFRKDDGIYAINWRAAPYFHCAHYSQQETVRWFVSLQGDYLPRHALCFNYRLKRWWIEEFSIGVGASCEAVLDGQPCVILGGESKRVLKSWEGCLDGPRPDDGTVRGTVTSAALASLTDSAATFSSTRLVGNTVSIVDGKGRGQTRRIVEVDGTTVRVDHPWLNLPDTTSTYQLGAVPWRYRSGWFRFGPEENSSPRRLEVVFEPVDNEVTVDIRVFRDFRGSPIEWKTRYTRDDANGLKSEDGSAYLVGDLTKDTGYLVKKFSGHREYTADGTRFWSVELSGFSNRDQVRISEATLEGAQED